MRNARGIDLPSVREAAEICVAAGADGITVHPRPDGRHILWSDVEELRRWCPVEVNIEGNPTPEFLANVLRLRPAQCTLVPDAPEQKTSDHGWMLERAGEPTADAQRLHGLLAELKVSGIRTSLFIDPDPVQAAAARALGADRVELYTEPYARAFGTPAEDATFERYAAAAARARAAGVGLNAGHDLNLKNLPRFLSIPGILEVSIGHALIADALRLGLERATREYLAICKSA